MTKKFPNLTPEESKGIDKLIYKNALQLKKDALLIAEARKSYSSATSLLILSAEETIKSILVLLHIEGYKVYKLKETHKFFFDHKIRHQIAQLIEMGSGLIESMMKYDEQKPTKLLKTKVNWLNDLVNGFFDIVKAAEPLIGTVNKTMKLQGFNDLKNKGFYVDFQNELLNPQVEVTEKIYKETLAITNRVFIFSKWLRIMHHSKLENHEGSEELKELKTSFKEFIDNHITKISFKEMNKIMKEIN
ncbi:AbiV family abortive infection protein [Tenacibaculum halocynthiae]|uniref:AbiV family abortive infection protein n=1 Tax=Tenacibaculum halocynthiae TaxID=1254437 RepID=UPI003D658F3D